MSYKSPPNAKPADLKLVILGKPAVGKSATIVRLLTRRFIWEYDPTLEFTYKHQASIDDEQISMDILDTSGEESLYREGHVRWADGFLLMYSITDRKSFEEITLIKTYLDEIKKARNVSLVVAGNKSDLEHERVVTTEEGEKLAASLACAFYETSAYEGDEIIKEAFFELCREVRRRKATEGRQRRRSSSQQVRQVFNRMLTKINSNYAYKP